jgi:hypothetical protein
LVRASQHHKNHQKEQSQMGRFGKLIVVTTLGLVAITGLAVYGCAARSSDASDAPASAAATESSAAPAAAPSSGPAAAADTSEDKAAPAPSGTPSADSAGRSASSRPIRDEKAKKTLEQARTAIGGETALSAVNALSVEGKLTRTNQGGEIKLDFLLPDKFKRTEVTSPIAGIDVSLIFALNGEEAWSDTKTNSGMAQVVVVNPNAGKGGPMLPARVVRADLVRTTLQFLLAAPSNIPVDFTYAGEAESEGTRADVIDAKGPDDFSARLFIDQKTHHLLMISYRGVLPRVMAGPVGPGGPPPADAPDVVDIELHFSDYQATNGISLPHHVTKTSGGTTVEEWTSIKYSINPSGLKPANFVKK